MTSKNHENDDKRKRVPFKWIDFNVTHANINGYAKNWFFLVHKSFKPALDIRFVEIINKNKTILLRDAEARKHGFDSLAALQNALKIDGIAKKDSEEYQSIIKHTVHDLIETEGSPLLYAFRETDSLESMDGDWYLQVTQAIPSSTDNPGEVGFQMYRRRTPTNGYTWERSTWHSTTQADFVDLLRHGTCSAIMLSEQALPSQAQLKYHAA